MDLTFSAEEEAFRAEVKRFLAENLPRIPKLRDDETVASRDDYLAWQRILYAKGWVAPHWPVEYGGTGWNITQRYIFDQEAGLAGAPRLLGFGLNMVGPVIYSYGTEAQKKQHLPGILSGDVWWCQGYSEPGAGSDLASLRTRAVRDGDDYIVNGQKTWTTLAQFADWMFCLVRTDPDVKPQTGISFLLIDMKTPGITVKPIVVLGGIHEVNDVFFDDVRVPVAGRIGEENKGWTYAKSLLVNERSNATGVGRAKRALEDLKQIARTEMEGGKPLIEDPDFARKIAELEIELIALEYTDLRILIAEARGEKAGPESSILKLVGTDIQQKTTELALDAVGYYGFPDHRGRSNNDYIGPGYAVGRAAKYFNQRKSSIFGGSNEVQRNIIAKAVLGL